MLSKIKNVVNRIVTILRPIASDLTQEKKDEVIRLRGVYLTALISLLSKAISMISIFITIPAILNYLGTELFGIWMTLSSIVAMLTFADMGIGNGIVNKLSKAIHSNSENDIRVIITNAFTVLLVVAMIINLLFYAVASLINWNSFLNLSENVDTKFIEHAIFAFVFCFSLNVLFSVVQKIQLAYQLGFVASIWQILGSVFSLGLLFLFIHLKLEMAWLVFAIAGVPAIFQFLNYLYFSFVICKSDFLKISNIKLAEMKSLLSSGVLFFALQISMVCTYTSDNVILNTFIGAKAVTEYSVHIRLFSIVPILMGMVLIPLWPAYSSARIKKDIEWIRNVWNKSIIMALSVSVIISGFILLFLPNIFDIWLKNKVQPIYSLAYLLFIWKLFESVGLAISCFLNGMDLIKQQAFIAVITAVVAICLKILFVHQIGITGVLLGTLIPFVLLTFIPMLFMALRFLKKGRC
ncbi:oligosaccharide flippase family protein [Escherichia albertii]|uniref:Putative O-antigen transporter n=1 Tax=Escherichia albertii TaxID=208962 RepID=A0A5A4U9R5_ESCAL|nr:oligosaccharide flippase family protein [Escherichia albertii]BBM62763.1 O-antigen flippase [Escherichia albertii]